MSNPIVMTSPKSYATYIIYAVTDLHQWENATDEALLELINTEDDGFTFFGTVFSGLIVFEIPYDVELCTTTRVYGSYVRIRMNDGSYRNAFLDVPVDLGDAIEITE